MPTRGSLPTSATIRITPDNPDSLSSDEVQTILQDGSGILWVGTSSDGLNRFDLATGRITRYRHDPLDETSFAGGWADALFEDRSGLIWVGTEEGINKFDPRPMPFTLLRHNPEDANSLGHDRVLAILEDPTGVLWLGTGNGLDRFDPATGSFTHYLPGPGQSQQPQRQESGVPGPDG